MSISKTSNPKTDSDEAHSLRFIAVRAMLFIPLLFNLCTAGYWSATRLLTPTGDEPHYLLLSKALWKLDLNLKPLYVEDATKEFLSSDAQRQPHVVKDAADRWYSIHSPGVPFLIAAPFKVAGVKGARMAMACFASLLPFLFFRVLRKRVNSGLTAAIFSVVLAVGLPFTAVSSQIYPEMPVGIILLYVADKLIDSLASRMMSVRDAWGICSVAACLPWFHVKNTPTLVLIVAAVVLSALRAENAGRPALPSRMRLIIPVLAPIVSSLLLFAYNYSYLGGILGPMTGSQSFQPQDWVPVLLGLHLDQTQGLFLQQPFWLLGVAGLPFLVKQRPLQLLFLTLVYLSIVMPNSMHTNWYGGYSFSGRFVLSAAVLWIFPLSYCAKALVQEASVLAKSLAVAGVAHSIALAFIWVPHPDSLYSVAIRDSPSVRNTLFPTWVKYSLPTFADFSGWYTAPVNWLAIGAVVGSAALGWALLHRKRSAARRIALSAVAIAGWCLPGAPSPSFTADRAFENEARLKAQTSSARPPSVPKCVASDRTAVGALEFQVGCMASGLRDLVGGTTLQPDGQPDSVIELGVVRGSGVISSIQVDLLEDARGQGRWDTSSSTQFWIVGVFRQNRPVASGKAPNINLAVKAGDGIQLRLTENSSVQAGKQFLVTLVAQDGHVATQTAVIP